MSLKYKFAKFGEDVPNLKKNKCDKSVYPLLM